MPRVEKLSKVANPTPMTESMGKGNHSPAKNLGRNWFRSLLKNVLEDSGSRETRQIRFEPLESRQLMAADFFESTSGQADLYGGSTADASGYYAASTMDSSSLVGEGEDAPNLVEFAKALQQAGVRFFGADWCPICTEQKNLFGDGKFYLPFIEMTNPDRTRNATAISENVTEYPTWEFANGTRVTGLQTLAQLSAASGVAIPTGSDPTFVEIPNQTVLNGSPLHVPVDAYDPNGGPLTITVTSSNPSVISAEMITNTKSLRIDVNGYGEMVFRLFADEAPRPVGRIEELVNSGFYTQSGTNKIIFHRVIDNFVLQAGDPTGTGSGGSSLPDFNDQFNFNLQHNRTGILSYAKSSDDTNDSQFFITEGAQRHLDFNHSIFGQLIEGDAVREGISRTQVSNSKPVNEISIKSAEIFNDTENGLIRLKALANTGSATITVTVTDSTGRTSTRTFTANAAADTANGGPFLSDITVPTTIQAGQETTLQLTGNDVEGDAMYFDATKVGTVDYTFSIDHTTGLLKLTPPANYTGQLQISVGVRPLSGSSTTQDTFDTQLLTFNVTSSTLTAPTGVDLVAESDTGVSNTDNITNASTMSFVVSGTVSGATVNLKIGNDIVGTAVATGTSTTIQTNLVAQKGQGTHSIVATQTLNGQTTAASPAIAVTFDNTAPAAIAANRLPTKVNLGSSLNFDLAHPDEGNGLRYILENAPAGLSINSTTGVMTWTPTQAQLGPQTATLRLLDAAGNAQVQELAIAVAEAAKVSVQLIPVDANGNVLTSLSINQEFFLRVVLTDLRNTGSPTGDGVFSAYLDIEYDPAIVELVGDTPLTYSDLFGNGRNTPVLSTPGQIDELGAFSSFSIGPGRAPQILATIAMRAKASGQAVFTSNPSEGQNRAFSIFKEDGAIPSERINFIPNTIAVGQNFTVVNDTFNLNEDSTNNPLNVLANDTIVTGSGAVLTIQSVGTTSNGGTVSIAGDGKSLIYNPAANYNGVETFTYTVRDQSGATATGTVTVQVNPVNDNPVAVADTITTVRAGDQNVFLNVLQNDTMGPDTGETLTVISVGTTSQGGTVTVASAGSGVVYTPKVGFTGTETFSYTISDGRGGTSTATVTVVVGPAVPPPTVVNDTFQVVEDAAAAEFNPLSNDTPAATGDTLTIISVSAPNGTASITSNGTRITYAPKANANGTELVVYTVRSSNGGVAAGTITFNISAVNDPPTAVDDNLDVLSQPNQTVDVLANDPNVDPGESYTITAVTQPASGQGTIQIASNGKSLIYNAPNTSFTGTVTFSYTISDGTSTDSADVTLRVLNFIPRDVGITFTSPIQGVPITAEYIPSVGSGAMTTPTVVRTSTGAQVNDVGPGEIKFTIPDLPFLTGSSQTVRVMSQFNDGDSLSTPVSIGTRDARYVDIRDFMGQNLKAGMTTAVTPNQAAHWYEVQGTWGNYRNVAVSLNSAGTSLTIRATNPSNQQVEATVALTDNRVQIRGREGSAMLVRLRAEPAQIFTNSSTTPAASNASGEGEGQPVSNNSYLDASSVDAAMQQIANDAVSPPSTNSNGSGTGSTEAYQESTLLDSSAVPIEDLNAIAGNAVSTGYRRGFRTR